ncbi:hypothetical protein GC167_06165 [bacterium]|nr:hypothetical protein [bacterium]
MRNILGRLGLVLLVLLGMEEVYRRVHYAADMRLYAPAVVRFDSVVGLDGDVLYLGESSNWTTGPEDRDMRSISQMVGDALFPVVVRDFTEPATHGGHYRRLLERIPDFSGIETVVVTLNLRSFGPDWVYSRLEPQLARQFLLAELEPRLWARLRIGLGSSVLDSPERLEGLRNRQWASVVLPAPAPYPTTRAWDRALNEIGWLDADRMRNQDSTELACHYVKSYGFGIDPARHPRVRDFDAMADWARTRGKRLVFLLLAENVQQAEALAGPEIAELMRAHADFLVHRYRSRGIEVVNALEVLPPSAFIDKDWTTEHYTEAGRSVLARRLTHQLQTQPQGDAMP